MENKQNRYKLSGSLQFLTDSTGRMTFPKETILKAIENYKKEIKENGYALGEMAPVEEEDYISIGNVSHKIFDVDINDDLNYTVEIEPLDTPQGKRLQELLKHDNAKIRFRGLGSDWDIQVKDNNFICPCGTLKPLSFDAVANDEIYSIPNTAVEMPIPLIDRDSVSIRTNDEYQDLKNSIMQLIHHKGYGVGNSAVATMLRNLGDYYDD